MKKYIIYSVAVAFALSAVFTACEKDKDGNGNGVVPGTDTEEGVVINGIRWATRNVDKPGTFAKKPEDAGMFYQWNRKIGWSSADPMINSNGGTTWNSSTAEGTTWESTNCPCPSGWRMPTRKELEGLAASDSYWGKVNGVSGRFFGHGENSLFFPAAGRRLNDYGALNYVGSYGFYWSSTKFNAYTSISLSLDKVYFGMVNYHTALGFSVRCVAEKSEL